MMQMQDDDMLNVIKHIDSMTFKRIAAAAVLNSEDSLQGIKNHDRDQCTSRKCDHPRNHNGSNHL